jgi:hypothetical protein
MTLPEKIKKYGLTQKDWYQHAHYTIVTRMGIDKIQAYESINIKYEAITSTPEFCVVKAIGSKDELVIETFGSAKFGGKVQNKETNKWEAVGNTTTWYVMEMAEKRAMSRAVLKITGFYELGVFGEDESEDFKTVKKEPLTDNQFHTLLLPENKKHIAWYLDNRDVSDTQRKELEALIK